MSEQQYAAPKLVFPHVPKTAGTSIIHWIQQHYGPSDILHEASVWVQFFSRPLEDWACKRFVRGHFGSHIGRYFPAERGFHRATMLRDPVERVLSHFWHQKYVPDFAPHYGFIREDDYTLDHFIDDPRTEIFVRNYQVLHLGFELERDLQYPELRRLLRFGEPFSAAQLRRATAFLESCDVVGTTDALGTLIDGLAALLRAPPARSLGHARSYRPSDFDAPPDVRAKIRRMNEADYEIFNLARALATKQERSRNRLVVRLKRVVMRNRNPLVLDAARHCAWRAGEPFLGGGWSDVNAYGDTSVPIHRWTIGDRPATIRVRLMRWRRYDIRVAVLRFVSPSQVSNLKVQVNGRALAWRMEPWEKAKKPGGGYLVAKFATRGSRNVEISFKVAEPLAFADVQADSSDRTRRGLAVTSIDIREDARWPQSSPRVVRGQPQPNDRVADG